MIGQAGLAHSTCRAAAVAQGLRVQALLPATISSSYRRSLENQNPAHYVERKSWWMQAGNTENAALSLPSHCLSVARRCHRYDRRNIAVFAGSVLVCPDAGDFHGHMYARIECTRAKPSTFVFLFFHVSTGWLVLITTSQRCAAGHYKYAALHWQRQTGQTVHFTLVSKKCMRMSPLCVKLHRSAHQKFKNGNWFRTAPDVFFLFSELHGAQNFSRTRIKSKVMGALLEWGMLFEFKVLVIRC